MWNRKELKQRGKAAFKMNYWMSVAAGLITSLAIAGLTVTTSYRVTGSEEAMSDPKMAVVAGVVGTVSLAAVLINYFVLKPVEVGGKKFFLNNAEGRADMEDILSAFKGNYMNNVFTMFLRTLLTVLWSLLFIIPGIVKMYAYRMVPYILAEHPEMSGMEVLRASEQMMKGQKWKAFVLDLSFIGWHILTCVTAGLVGVFYTNPYFLETDAELYKAVKAENMGYAAA